MQFFAQLSLSIISKLLLFLLFHCLALFESSDDIAFLSEESAKDKILLKANWDITEKY